MSTAAVGPADIRAAYRHCELITKTQARNFSYGIRLLPGDKRRALSAVYAFARRIDDIGDGTLPAADKLAALAEARSQVAGLAASGKAPPDDHVLIALADASRRFDVPLGAFGELIDGCEADARGVSYGTFSDLEHYCRCVAGSIGRLSLGVFGSSEPAAAAPLADALGVALQLTNILRDIREDLGNGRVYLPAEDLARFGCTLSAGPAPAGRALAGQDPAGQDPAGQDPAGRAPAGQDPAGQDTRLTGDAGLERLVRFEAERAMEWYATGMRLMPLLDRRSAASAGAMAGIYLRLLKHISADPAVALRQRQSLPASQKAMVAARCLAGMTRRRSRRARTGDAAGGAETITPAPGARS